MVRPPSIPVIIYPWLILQVLVPSSNAFAGTSSTVRPSLQRTKSLAAKSIATWSELESLLEPAYSATLPVSIDSVLDPKKPSFSTDRPTLFRERHGWCPYSERVWLTLELGDTPYDTVRIDNTGGPRPSYFGGQTPQMRWPDGKTQGESMDLVYRLDEENNNLLNSNSNEVQDCIAQFRNIFPKARPSSRAAYLFQWSGEPLWRSTFEETLQATNDLLGQTEGPYFCGSTLSAADVAWAPFLERYRYQLPCLHRGLNPCSSDYPQVKEWYDAVDRVPAYACRVKGDASSWRKVLLMAGFGNAGAPPPVKGNMAELAKQQAMSASACIDVELWKQYASSRPYLADTPGAEAALVMTRNRNAIITDVIKQSKTALWKNKGLLTSEEELDEAMRAMVFILASKDDGIDVDNAKDINGVGFLASFLDERMCVPRDMGSMSAAAIKHLAWELST